MTPIVKNLKIFKKNNHEYGMRKNIYYTIELLLLEVEKGLIRTLFSRAKLIIRN